MPGEQAEALRSIARELSRRNDLLEIEMLCKTAEALKSTAKSSFGSLHTDGYIMAEELAEKAYRRISRILTNGEKVS